MSNSTIAPLQGETLLFNQLEFVVPTTVIGIFYGIAFTLFCLYIHALAPQLRNGDRTIQARFMLVYSIVIMLCGLYDLFLNAWVTMDAYVKPTDNPEGPYSSAESMLRTPSFIVVSVCTAITHTLTSAIQVWRVWVVWRATRYAHLVVVLPALGFLTFTGLGLRSSILENTLSGVESDQLSDITARVEMALRGATTVLCTVSISIYLIFKQRRQRELIEKDQGASGYMNIVAMIVESYALETIWLLADATTTPPGQVFFAESLVSIEILAYLLMQYRVARGTAYESQGRQTHISSLRWNHSNNVTTQLEETREFQDSSHVSTLPEASSGARVSGMA